MARALPSSFLIPSSASCPQKNMYVFSRLVFITGGNTGIGFETVKALIQSTKEQYHIFVGGRTQAKALAAMDQLKGMLAPSSSTAEAIQIDVTDDESIEKAFNYVKDRYGWLDILINNAGMVVLLSSLTLG